MLSVKDEVKLYDLSKGLIDGQNWPINLVDVDFKYVSPKLFQYHWADGNQVKKPIKCSAPKYIDFLMTWVQDQLDDETLFPSKIGVPFPNNFLTNAKTILKRLFRVYAHVYHQHFKVKKLNSWSIIR